MLLSLEKQQQQIILKNTVCTTCCCCCRLLSSYYVSRSKSTITCMYYSPSMVPVVVVILVWYGGTSTQVLVPYHNTIQQYNSRVGKVYIKIAKLIKVRSMNKSGLIRNYVYFYWLTNTTIQTSTVSIMYDTVLN